MDEKQQLILVCKMCSHHIAEITEDLKLPLLGAMFVSRDPKHGYPAPWSPVANWEAMQCPACALRPWILENIEGPHVFETNWGPIVVNDNGYFFVGHVEEDDDKDSGEAEDELTDTEAADTRSDSGEAEDEQAETSAGDADDDAEVVAVATPEEFLDYLIKEGKVVKKGSWYKWEGNNYYRNDLLKKLTIE